MAIRSRDRKRAAANLAALAGVTQAPLSRPVGKPPAKHQASPQQLAFKAYVESGMTPSEARIEAGLPPIN